MTLPKRSGLLGLGILVVFVVCWYSTSDGIFAPKYYNSPKDQHVSRRPNFILVTGAEGSGTNLMTKVLGYSDKAVNVHGQSMRSISSDTTRLNELMAEYWLTDGYQSAEYLALRAEIHNYLFNLIESFPNEALIFHRSSPFTTVIEGQAPGVPNFHDWLTLFSLCDPNVFPSSDSRRNKICDHWVPGIVVMYRCEIDSSISAFRRGFWSSLLVSGRSTERNLIYLSSQIASLTSRGLGGSICLVNYESFIESPRSWLSNITTYLQWQPELDKLAQVPDLNPQTGIIKGNYSHLITNADRRWLSEHFSSARRELWRAGYSSVYPSDGSWICDATRKI